jgi:hypothetical protein
VAAAAPRVASSTDRSAGRCSVAFVAVNAEQAEDWNGASGREFIEQRERHRKTFCVSVRDVGTSP